MTIKTSLDNKNTRYVQGGISTLKQNSIAWWNRAPDFTKRSDTDIIIFSLPVLYAGRPDLLAFDLYQNNNLEWVILQYNNIVDINEEFVTGAYLIVPSKDRLFSSMLIKTLIYEES
jgi:hypothetical protein